LRIAAKSSKTICVEIISHPSPRQTATTAGPDASSRFPAAAESLTVITAILMR
jgi:hypothetical protein